MSKSFKIFLIATAVCVLIFVGYKSYQWVNRDELNITITLNENITNQQKTTILEEIFNMGGRTKLIYLDENGSADYEINLPWYFGLPGLQSIEDFIADFKNKQGVKDAFPYGVFKLYPLQK